jgi:hypothetical protein
VGCIAPSSVDICLTCHPKQHYNSVPTQIPIGIVPIDLRFPNREFILVLDVDGKPERVERFDISEVPDAISQEWYLNG